MTTFFSIPALFTALMVLSLFSCKKEKVDAQETVTDIDGNVYHTVTIGTQVWMVENLKTTRYRNGDPIPNVTNDPDWENLSSGAYCDYNNRASFSAAYGRLYNWNAVQDNRNIAPSGWHVANDNDWTQLTSYLGGEKIAGGKLKSVVPFFWDSPNTGATNESGFSALPGGFRYGYGDFAGIATEGYWWCLTESNTDDAWHRFMRYDENQVSRFQSDFKGYGLSVRCLRD